MNNAKTNKTTIATAVAKTTAPAEKTAPVCDFVQSVNGTTIYSLCEASQIKNQNTLGMEAITFLSSDEMLGLVRTMKDIDRAVSANVINALKAYNALRSVEATEALTNGIKAIIRVFDENARTKKETRFNVCFVNWLHRFGVHVRFGEVSGVESVSIDMNSASRRELSRNKTTIMGGEWFKAKKANASKKDMGDALEYVSDKIAKLKETILKNKENFTDQGEANTAALLLGKIMSAIDENGEQWIKEIVPGENK